MPPEGKVWRNEQGTTVHVSLSTFMYVIYIFTTVLKNERMEQYLSFVAGADDVYLLFL